MKAAVLIRSGSLHSRPGFSLGSPCGPGDRAGVAFLRRSPSARGLSPRSAAIHVDGGDSGSSLLRRARSEADLRRSGILRPGSAAAARAPAPPRVAEEEDDEEGEEEYSSGGMGKGTKIGGGGRGGEGGDSNENRRIGDYYKGMLRSDPGNPLLLRNYARFLHEVEGDVKGAEEYYGRAILASPDDGDLLSLYGTLLWETHRERERAAAYFERAVEAAPQNCYVMASYAKFLWDAGEDEDVETEESSPPLVEAF
ncbi:uncharacterized protein LOC109714583 [Ananas comosus]|uniref:Uncharacterized protein LOC109714583 n=1 Tax=Ananas comosus TaxID=4615 RepID=A0A6P5FFY5_ANACO|nr:uncharacterized protein LOC109714583 [Ananas comosus]